MKKVILKKSQLKKIQEASSVNIAANATDNSLSAFSKVATDTNTTADIQKAKVAGDVNLVVGGPDSSDDQPVQTINVANGQTVADAINNQGSDELVRNGSRLCITGDGLGESLVFTKKTLEEARLSKIKRSGKVLTKKELTERFLK
jgi:hypothetical protein